MGKLRQQGQALIYGMFMLIGSLTALFFLFNTGQLASEKTKLVNTADAVAYSAGVLHARALNFDAYNNRALMANEVLVAQMVSLASWAQYAKRHVENVPVIFPECVNVYPAAGIAAFNYDAAYGAMCYVLAQPGNPVTSVIEGLGAIVPDIASGVVSAVELNKEAIKAAQGWVHSQSHFENMRAEVLQQVADRNYAGDGSVKVHTGSASAGDKGGQLTDQWAGFVSEYTGEKRARMGTATAVAAASDKFVDDRHWTANAFLPSIIGLCLSRRNSVKRRGGTNLVGLDEWVAEDTESFWFWHLSGGGIFKIFSCDESETPIAWGTQRAAPAGKEQGAPGARLGDSPTVNPGAHSMASSSAWSDYTGIPAYYDLSESILNDAKDPVLRFAVRLERAPGNTRTSDGTSAIATSARLNKFSNGFAGGVMSTIATSEVYFERPWFNTGDTSYATGYTDYVVTQNQSTSNPYAGKSHELGSLFNPYWQVRLATNSAADVSSQQQAQGLGVAP